MPNGSEAGSIIRADPSRKNNIGKGAASLHPGERVE
jgi:hypothetical protein